MKNRRNQFITRENFEQAEDAAVKEMLRLFEGRTKNSDELEMAAIILELVTQVTTKIEGLLFGEEEYAIDEFDMDDEFELEQRMEEENIVVVDGNRER